jgi:hypothetical protein
MKKSMLLILLSFIVLSLMGCGGGSKTVNDVSVAIHVQDSKSGVLVANATVTVNDEKGVPLNGTADYTTDNNGDVSIVVKSGVSQISIKTKASGYSDQTNTVMISSATQKLSQTVSLLSVGSTVSPVNKGVNVDSSGSGAEVDITDAVFKNANGETVEPSAIDFTALNPAENPSAFPGSPDITMPDGSAGLMVSSGMLDVVFRDENGDPLVLDPGTPVKITMPLYSDLDPTTGKKLFPGSTVSFWSMDSDTGKWTQEGSASVISCSSSPVGICAQGEVTHFSWWNTDFAISATTKNLEVIDKETNETIDERTVTSMMLTATFTAAKEGADGGHGTTAVRSTTIKATDTLRVGDDFDVVFVLEVTYSDGTKAARKYEYTWAEVSELDTFIFEISKDEIYTDITLTSYETEYSSFRTWPLYIQRTMIGIEGKDVTMAVDGVIGGNNTVGTISCGEYGNYCTYTKGTKVGVVTISATSKLDENVSDEVMIDVSGPSLAIKTSYSYSYNYSWSSSYVNNYDPSMNFSYHNDSNGTYEYSYFNYYGLYLNNYLLQNATILSPVSFIYGGAKNELMIGVDTKLDESLYDITIECKSSSGGACSETEEFAKPFTFSASDLPATMNGSNRYRLTATNKSDPNLVYSLPIYYYGY